MFHLIYTRSNTEIISVFESNYTFTEILDSELSKFLEMQKTDKKYKV